MTYPESSMRGGEGLLLPQYPGDDTRPTSRKEIAGWYSYGWAAEVFTVCAMGSFLPITLEQMARDRGVLLSDKVTPCRATWKGPQQLSPHETVDQSAINMLYQGRDILGASQCVVYIFGVEINTASFAMYTFSVSVLVQAVLIISMSGAADHGSYRKLFLLIFAVVGSISTMLFLSVVPKVYLLGALFAVIANTCFGASFVLLNSFLPLIVRHHPSLLGGNDGISRQGLLEDNALDNTRNHANEATTPLLYANQVDNRTAVADAAPVSLKGASQELELSTMISSYGIGIGYIGAVLLQILCILVVIGTHQTTFSLRLVLFLIGLWWLVFTIPAALWLRPRPGPPLPCAQDGRQHRSWPGYILYAWKALGRTVVRTRRLKDILLFLASWFLLSDGIATVSGTAVLFAKTQLDMQPAALGMINVVAMLAGVFGAFSWSYISRALNLRASQTIIACIVLFELVPLYGILGFIPAIRDLGYLGLQQPWEMFPLSVVYGLVMGGLSSYCRSFFGELIPPGYEAAFYALYAITDKGSSIFGPAIVGMITDRYGEIRPAFVFLAILIILPLPLMLLVDVDRGKRDALALSAELEGSQKSCAPRYGSVSCGRHDNEDAAAQSG
ncbi:MFS transporter [Aspergillus alliaceus]|uniref:MFS transporter n=1 Tax=Petromyces alliaceus TaxID=209559 RepID=UPI0012A5ECB3|nr:autophagy-related protein 22-like protein [Aspergillus alliaceus]KAB8230558.1 autophagy-related protein 22-like protein [Aspergillus alliaceus]